MAKELDSFLDGEDGPHDEPAPAVEEAPRDAAPAPEPAAKPTTEPEPPEDDAPLPNDRDALLAVVRDERNKRRDHKGRADTLTGENAALKAELETFRKATEARAAAPPPPAPAAQEQRPPMPIPNPVEDPQGYHNYVEWRRTVDKLDLSEAMLRDKVGDDAEVDRYVDVFKAALKENPALRPIMEAQRHPWQYAYQQGQKILAMQEIGTDPTAYRTKLEADIRARIESEMAGIPQQQPPANAAPRPVLPQSLGTARSAGPRSAAPLNIPEDFGDILRRPERRRVT